MTIPSGRRNVTAGFSIVTTTGTNTSPATFGHGLNSQPEFIIAKSRDTAAGSSGNLGFPVYHKQLGVTTTQVLYLNSSNSLNNRGATTFDLANGT